MESVVLEIVYLHVDVVGSMQRFRGMETACQDALSKCLLSLKVVVLWLLSLSALWDLIHGLLRGWRCLVAQTWAFVVCLLTLSLNLVVASAIESSD